VKFAGIVAPYIWTPVEIAAGKRPFKGIQLELVVIYLGEFCIPDYHNNVNTFLQQVLSGRS